jgi:hypothetical protein
MERLQTNALRKIAVIQALFVGLVLAMVSSGNADWINLSGAQSAPNIAEIHVNDDHVRVVLEIYVGDVDKFVDLLPDAWIRQAGVEPPPIEERMRRFSAETFQFITGDKQNLEAELKLVEPRLRQDRPNPFAGMINPMTRQPVPGPPEDKRILYAELIYPFASKPKMLTIIPPHGKGGRPGAAIGFIAYHKGVPVLDYRYLSEDARMHLDWDDPWYSRFEKKALKRWQQSGLKTFLYVEPYEVRHETLVRVKDLQAWMDLDLRGDEFIEVDEVEPLKRRAGEFFLQHSKVRIDGLQHSKVRIDGKELRPILDRVNFVKYTMTRTFFLEQPERMPFNTAMLGVIITYLTEGIPQEVMVDWELFSDRIQKVPTMAVDPAGPFPSYVTPDDNVLTWTNFLKTYQMPTVAVVTVDESLTRLKVPVGTVVCLVALLPIVFQIAGRRKKARPITFHLVLAICLVAGSILLYPSLRIAVARPSVMVPKITNEEAVAVLHSLLKNVYRAFDFREEEDVYDRLATSVTGSLLEDIYLENRKSLVVTQAGGARAKVKEVEILDVDVKRIDDRPLGWLFHAQWTAMGTVGHWGHIHTRKNHYDARITVEPQNGVWKITHLELLEEKRIDPYAQSDVSKS